MAEHIFITHHTQPTQLNITINDALDVMQDENAFMNTDMSVYGSGRSDVYTVSSLPQNEISNDVKKKAYVKIIEEPQAKALRFRYICEGRSAGSIPGVTSTAENKTYPTIKVIGYKGPAMVVVSCITIDTPYRPHPHNLVGKDGCRKGICSMRINNDSMECSFPNLGIQCIKRKDVEEALRIREEQRIDPFHTGFSHRDQPQNIDLNAVRLCFQVFLKDEEKGKFSIPLQPVVSAAIYDKKATSDLIICKLSDCSSNVIGGKDIILLCDKVNKDDIQIRFYEMRGDRIHWQAFGDFQASDVHKQVAISFKTPKYDNLEIESSVRVFIQLVRPSDQSKSEPRPFDYLPLESDPYYVKRKLAKWGNSTNRENISKFLDVFPEANMVPKDIPISPHRRPVRTAVRTSRILDKVKAEPQDTCTLSPSPELGATSILQKSPVLPHHTSGGGIVYQIPPQQQTVAPFIIPHSSLYYAEATPVNAFAVDPIAQIGHVLPSSYVRSNFSSFAEAHTGIYDNPPTFAINPLMSPMKLSRINDEPTEPHEEEMLVLKRTTEPSVDSDLIRQINSAELIPFDSTLLNNFSTSLNFSDSIDPQTNQLDSKPSDEMSVDGRSTAFEPNIPFTSAGSCVKPEDPVVTTISDSLKNLAKDLEYLNSLSKDINKS